jgi:flagellar hook protein FlgE
MGITSALVTALSGLSTSQSQIDVVGNNIANVNTVGFKSSQLDFKTQFLENFSYGSAPNGNLGGTNPLQIGLGASAGAITKNFTDGSLRVTGVPTNLAIQGGGMFILKDGTQQVYTRDGSFQLNGLNQLVSGTGALVQGYGVDNNFQVVPGTIGDITIPKGTLTVAEATTFAKLTGNLNASGPLPTTVSHLDSTPIYLSNGAGGINAGSPPTAATLLTDVTDLSGVPLYQAGDVITLNATKGSNNLMQTMTVSPTSTLGDLETFLNGTLGINTSAGANGPIAAIPGVGLVAGTDGTGNAMATLTVDGNLGQSNDIALNVNSFITTRGTSTFQPFSWNKTATADGESIYTTMPLFDSLGSAVNVNIVASLTSETSSGSTWTFYATSPDDMPDATGAVQSVVGMGTLSFDTSGKLLNASNSTINISRAQTGAVPVLPITLDFSGTSALTDSASLLQLTNNDGSAKGTLDSFNIGVDGVITGTFSGNGQTRVIGQIALATFRNEQGLVDQGNNNYTTGPNSGTAIITAPDQLGAGRVLSGSLELSNVDLSTEFVQLIAASTAFSASSRVISSSNSLLQDLLSAAR